MTNGKNDSIFDPERGPGEQGGEAPAAPERETDCIEINADPLAAAEAEIARLKDQLLRALAETENLRRRAEREREDTAKYAIAGFAREILAVGDNLHLALANIPAEARAADKWLDNLAVGVEVTERELLAVFERLWERAVVFFVGIRRIDPLGEPFDPNYHQAMTEIPGTGKPAGTVVQVMRSGYVIHDRLLRPAMVAVAKGDAAETAPQVDTTA